MLYSALSFPKLKYYLGVICGSETISEEFRKLIESKVDLDTPNRDLVILKLVDDFNSSYKRNFGRGTSMVPATFDMPGAPGTILSIPQ